MTTPNPQPISAAELREIRELCEKYPVIPWRLADMLRLVDEVERLREMLQDITDVAASRQRTEWRNSSEQDEIDRCYAYLDAIDTDSASTVS